METIVTYTSIYLVSTEVAPGLPPETRYVFGSTSAPNMALLGYVVGPPGFPGLGSQSAVPRELVRLAVVGKFGLSWEPAGSPAKTGPVADAREAKVCRVCHEPMGDRPATYEFGREYAHTTCLEGDEA